MIAVMDFSGHFCAAAGPMAPGEHADQGEGETKSAHELSLLLPLACR